ncbi:MAG: TMEM165/GDT1 family protein [Xanthomonadales bacterium]|nr:TMEM165/GDT1 family protein [Xanthomonadales bacterium]
MAAAIGEIGDNTPVATMVLAARYSSLRASVQHYCSRRWAGESCCTETQRSCDPVCHR